MTIEEIKYDFTGHTEHFRRFFHRILKLMIISKLNCQESSKTSVGYFNKIISNIDHCKAHRVKYGKPMMFARLFDHEFTYQSIRVTIRVTAGSVIEIRLESIISNFVKLFDELSSGTKSIKWRGNSTTDRMDIDERSNHAKDENPNAEDQNTQQGQAEAGRAEMEIMETFFLLEAFIESIYTLASSNPHDSNKRSSSSSSSSLAGKAIEIKDVSVARKNLIMELVIDGRTIIMSLSPNKNKSVSTVLDDDDKTGDAIKGIILQSRRL